jgi:hypothetical protein
MRGNWKLEFHWKKEAEQYARYYNYLNSEKPAETGRRQIEEPIM